MIESMNGRLEVPRLRAKLVSVFLAGMVGVELGYAWWALKLRGMLDTTTGQITDPGFLDHVRLGERLDTLNLVGIVLTGAVFIAWFHKAYSNLPALGPVPPDYSPGKAIWGWIVPIMSLFVPYQMAIQIWDRTRAGEDDGVRDTGRIVLLWWFSWLLMGVVHWIVRFSSEPDSVGALSFYAHMVVIAGVASAVSACLAIAVVRRLTARLAACEGPHAEVV